MSELAWLPLPCTESKRLCIEQHVRDLALRLQNSEQVLEMSRIAAEQSKYRMWPPGYRLQCLAEGPLGLALLYSELERLWPGEGWGQSAHTYFSLSPRQQFIEGSFQTGLFSGASGLLYTAHTLAAVDATHLPLYKEAEEQIYPAIEQLIAALPVEEEPQQSHYDLMSGALGIGTLLLSLEYTPKRSLDLLMLLFHLLWLGKRNIQRDVKQYDHWFYLPGQRERQLHWQTMGAYIGYGMRRGLAGLIAFLCILAMSDFSIDKGDVLETLGVLAAQLRQTMDLQRLEHGWQRSPERDTFHPQNDFSSLAWCDGIYGSAYALWLAGNTLSDEQLRTFALECFSLAGQRFRQGGALIGPSLCHGAAGMLQICCRVASATGESTLIDDAHAICDYLLDLFEPDRPFGYRDFEPEFIRVDVPWLLNGACGTALALLTTISPHAPTWDRLLLLA